MMAMNVKVISKEIIKPTIPTPHQLNNLKLSFIDQLFGHSIYVPIILFFEAHDGQSLDHVSVLLKQSLSETLTRFYPLAGKLLEDFSVDCNDDGVEFSEVRVHCKLLEVIKVPDLNMQNIFLPFKSYGNANGNNVLLAIQLNVFDCGGVAIGVCISHKIADGTSAAVFVNAWAAITRGDEAVYPKFDAAIHFPPRDISGFTQNPGVRNDKIVTKRFVFEKSSIDKLKKQGYCDKVPTRVEAVSAFIWRRFIAMYRAKTKHAKVCVAGHAVNIRERMVPPLPSHSFGNLWQVSNAATQVEVESEYHTLVSEVSKSIKGINSDGLKILQTCGNMEWLKNKIKQRQRGEVESLNFTSWCRFPFYEIDFGWGTPIWACAPPLPYKNVIVLMSTKEGDGIEAVVNMLEEDMEIFEHDQELLQFVSRIIL